MNGLRNQGPASERCRSRSKPWMPHDVVGTFPRPGRLPTLKSLKAAERLEQRGAYLVLWMTEKNEIEKKASTEVS